MKIIEMIDAKVEYYEAMYRLAESEKNDRLMERFYAKKEVLKELRSEYTLWNAGLID